MDIVGQRAAGRPPEKILGRRAVSAAVPRVTILPKLTPEVRNVAPEHLDGIARQLGPKLAGGGRRMGRRTDRGLDCRKRQPQEEKKEPAGGCARESAGRHGMMDD
jgi:hypothetical protein